MRQASARRPWGNMRKISRLLVGGLLFSLAGCVVEARRLALCDTVDGCDGTTYGSE